MTAADVYVVICAGAIVGLIGATVGYCVDHWADWQRQAAAHRLDARLRWRYALGSGPGTVGNPVDPSPRRALDRDEA